MTHNLWLTITQLNFGTIEIIEMGISIKLSSNSFPFKSRQLILNRFDQWSNRSSKTNTMKHNGFATTLLTAKISTECLKAKFPQAILAWIQSAGDSKNNSGGFFGFTSSKALTAGVVFAISRICVYNILTVTIRNEKVRGNCKNIHAKVCFRPWQLKISIILPVDPCGQAVGRAKYSSGKIGTKIAADNPFFIETKWFIHRPSLWRHHSGTSLWIKSGPVWTIIY